ncbi:glycosyltransferase family 4 protein [Thermoplasmatales archaeon AK]|nr:glycosyltransferase family 4 protein [Thermoplasmatales archaeon AK]
MYSEIPHLSTPSKLVSDIISEGPYILYVGRLAPNKGIDLLIRAYHRISSKTFDIKLVLAGQDAGMKDEITRLLHDLDLEGKVFLTGFIEQNDLHWLYRSAMFFCSPSTYGEAQNMTAAQALAYGKPTIVSDTGGMGDFYRNIEGAIVVRKGQLEDLAAAMAYLIDNHNKIKIKQKTKVLYTWEEVAKETEHLYEELM